MAPMRGVGDEAGDGVRNGAERLRPSSVVPGIPPSGGRDLAAPLGVVPPADMRFRLADQLAPMVDVWERLLAAHQPDAKGRCRTCTQGGTGLPATQWPCSLHGLAELARRRHALAEGA